MVENRMGWERYELKKWRFGNDGIKRMGIGGLEMGGGSTILIVGIDRIGRKWGGKVQLVCFFQKNVSRYSQYSNENYNNGRDMSGRGRDWIWRVGMERFLKSRLLLQMSSSYCIKVVNKTLKGVHYSKKKLSWLYMYS